MRVSDNTFHNWQKKYDSNDNDQTRIARYKEITEKPETLYREN